MRYLTLLTVAAVAIGCSSHKKDKIITDRELLQAKYNSYRTMMLTVADSDGFVDTDKCDSLMNTALGNETANIFASEVSDGKWLRRPPTYPDCYSTKSSASDISRDMLLGVMYRCVANNDLPCLHRLWHYGEVHSWSMGVNGPEHSIFTPDYIALLAQSIYKVSDGSNNYAARYFKFPTLIPKIGFEAQLQAIFMIVRGIVYGGDALDSNLTNKLAEQNPNNPLMQYVGENYDAATTLLLNSWPDGRLPTSSDWCADWLLSEAPDGAGRKSCPDQADTHSGGDLLFVAKLLLE